VTAPRPSRLFSLPSWPATGAVVAVLVLLEARVLEPDRAQRTSDLLQLALSATAAAACLRAARRAAARVFWTLIGLGCLCWACGQVFWVTRAAPFSPEATYAEADVLFTASTAFFLVAFVTRPDRGRTRAVAAAIDVTVLGVAMVYLFGQTALVHLLAGDVLAYEASSTFLFDLRGLLILPVILWALRDAEPWSRPLYAGLAPAFVLLVVGGLITNQAFEGRGIAGPYQAGLYDLPWTLPFVWIAVAATRWMSVAWPPPSPPARAGWARTRRATVAAFVALMLFPVAEILISAGSAPQRELARWRAAFALAGTVFIALLYLIRQHLVLREAEATLREGEERLRTLLDTSSEGVGVYGPDLRVRYVSGAMTRLTGYQPQERIGRSALEVIHPDDAARLKGDVAMSLRSPGERVRSAIRARTRDGRWRDMEADIVNRLGEPAVQGIVANFRDVTERVRAEEERERSLSLLEATLESTADGILVVERGGRIERFNRKFAAMCRMPEELLGSRDDERALGFVLDQLEDPGAFLEQVRDLYARPEAESFDTLRLRDGRVFERYSQPQRLGGEVVGRVWSFRDVSERARAEEAMARLVAIIEATPDFVGTFDGALGLLYVNRAGRRMVGLAGDETVAGRGIAELHPPRAAARVLEEAIPGALREGTWTGEGVLRHRAGREIPVLQVVLAHRSPGGEVEFFSTIARDISQRQREEEELRRSQTMAALGALVAGVAHEVRNPLFGISSTLDAFEARYSGQPDHRQYVQVLREQLGRLNALMTDLLEYGKPTGLVLSDAPLEAVVTQALSACAPLAERARVALESHLDPGLPPLRLDRKRLSQVFANLVENALQHSPAGSTVRVTARLVRDEGTSWVECVVEDSGPGFRVGDLPHVFEPFFTRRKGGTGLGLSIVERIVGDHGGTIAAGNRPGGGARLRVRLPVAPGGPPQ
jgi:PAS domain S-box-containing protein